MSFPIDFQPSHRMFIAGTNGSGKSVLATDIANRWDRVLILDPKNDPGAIIPNAAVCYGFKAAKAALPGRVIYRPLPNENARLADLFDELCKIVFRATAHGIVIHELGDLGRTDQDLGTWTATCFKQGRSLRIPMIACTQRPVNVPIMAKSEALHVACFSLMDGGDRREMAAYMGAPVAPASLPLDHSFWYRGPDLALVRVAPLPLPR